MKTLKEIQDQFEDKNRDGEQVNILAYHPGQACPIIAERKMADGIWQEASYTDAGLIELSLPASPFNLIKKKRHLPKDILCEAWNTGGPIRKVHTNGDGGFYLGGATSITNTGMILYEYFKVIKNPPQPWFGGDSSPIPEECEFRVYFNAEWSEGKEGFMWGHQKGFSSNITAFQILGSKE